MTLLRRIFQPNTLIELFPALLFFLVNLLWGFRAATVAGMLATPAAIAAGWLLLRRIPTIPLVSLALVLALGGASLLLDDATFVKLRPTLGSGLFALALAVGLLFRPSFLQRAFAGQLFLSCFGWRLLTACWIAVALLSAVTNEILWRRLTTDGWVAASTALAPIRIAAYVAVTTLVARRTWQPAATSEEEEERP